MPAVGFPRPPVVVAVRAQRVVGAAGGKYDSATRGRCHPAGGAVIPAGLMSVPSFHIGPIVTVGLSPLLGSNESSTCYFGSRGSIRAEALRGTALFPHSKPMDEMERIVAEFLFSRNVRSKFRMRYFGPDQSKVEEPVT